jgi:hypothetical protein
MRDLAINRLRDGGSSLPVTLALAVVMVAGAAPAHAQDLFGLFRMMFQPSIRVPASPPYDFRTAPHMQRRAARRARAARAEPTAGKQLKARPMGEAANPVPELLADGTLRRGDIVMFPDGPRVFVGQRGARHALDDFEPVSPNTKSVPQATRKLLAQVRPGWNGAWAADVPAAGERIAARDVDATGSLKPRR